MCGSCNGRSHGQNWVQPQREWVQPQREWVQPQFNNQCGQISRPQVYEQVYEQELIFRRPIVRQTFVQERTVVGNSRFVGETVPQPVPRYNDGRLYNNGFY